MATYSTNLALTLLATGEGAGTWGNTTNTNLGTLLEQAISGYATESLTAGTTLTLTIPNGATGVARNMYLEFTGNGSTVIVPSNKKLYFVYNNCSSGTITFKVDGQTGVSIPKGSKQILVSNGTDVQQAVTPAPTGTTTNSITALGTGAGTALTSGSAVVTVGYNAGAAVTSGNFNTLVGHRSGATISATGSNTCLGYEAGSEYGNSFNTFVGTITGRNINSSENTAVGYGALRGILGSATGVANCAFGVSAAEGITTGTRNVVIGGGAGLNMANADSNVFVGFQAGYSCASGAYNIAIGRETGDAISSGNYNTLVGTSAGGAINTGGANTIVGDAAGTGITTGNNNSALGDSAYSSGNYSNSTCLGYSSAVTGSNQVQLGNSSTTSYAYGSVQDRSDERDKADIRDTQLGLNFVMALRPRDFKWDMREDYRTSPPTKPSRADYADEAAYEAAVAQWQTDYSTWETNNSLANLTHDGTHKRSRYHHGLIAQEVKQTMDTMGVDFGGYQDHTIKGGDAVLTLGYEELVAPLIKAIQELKADFDEYKRTHP
jgi:hypothetical protein